MKFIRELLAEEFRKREDVFGTFRQRWLVYLELAKAVIKILAKTTLGDGFLHILVGRRDDAHIGTAFRVSTDRHIYILLQYPKQ